MPALVTGLIGLLGGLVIGILVQRSRLCTFGAMEDALMGQDWRRMKVFGLALAVALLVTQALILTGVLDADRVTYLVPARLPIAGLVAILTRHTHISLIQLPVIHQLFQRLDIRLNLFSAQCVHYS